MFENIRVGEAYSRKALADLWGYASYYAIARGVVTPRGTDKIILFVTEDKPSWQPQYHDHLRGDELSWEGPTDHFAEQRIVDAAEVGDEIHLFYRKRRHLGFRYLGQVTLASHRIHATRPSEFTFQVR